MTKSPAKSWGNFESGDDVPVQRLIWCSSGPEKSGKNHFGLSAPGPVAVQCFDVLGLQGTVEKFRAGGKEVMVTKYRFNINDTNAQTQAEDIVAKFREDYAVALRNARTIQWDETELWQVFRYAQFGKASDAPKDYDRLNFMYSEMIHQVDETGVNLQLIQKVKEKWMTVDEIDRNGRKVARGKPSGLMAPTGFKEVKYIVQANLAHSWNKEEGFVVDVLNCRQNMAVAGERFVNTSFSDLAQLIFDGTDESDWQ